jgi:two-component system phosphate regulon sensor histidine kinase PhoR
MKKRLLSLNITFAVVILITFLLLDKEGHVATNLIVLGVVMTIFIMWQYFYLNSRWFKHLEELPSLIEDVHTDKKVRAYELSREPLITDLQYGVERLADHIEKMDVKYGYRKGQLEAILGSLKLGLVAITQEGTVIFHNPKFTEIFKLGASIQGKNIYENIFDTNLLEVLEHSLDTDLFVLPNVVQPDGLIYSYRGLEIKSGDVRAGTLIIIEDVTKVYKVDKMKTEFVSNVTHELKTPLTSIRGFTETLQQVDPNDVETRDRFLGIIEAEAERLSLLINDILYLSEVENSSMKEKDLIDLNRECNDVIELSKPNLNENVELNFVADKHYVVPFEQYKFKQMLINLVSNSIKYTDEGTITVELSSDLDFVVLKVIDTGIGIPKKNQGRIFERFYRVDKGRSRMTGGTGLGLSIVKHIAERNECQIHLESELGEGTTVTVFIKK